MCRETEIQPVSKRQKAVTAKKTVNTIHLFQFTQKYYIFNVLSHYLSLFYVCLYYTVQDSTARLELPDRICLEIALKKSNFH